MFFTSRATTVGLRDRRREGSQVPLTEVARYVSLFGKQLGNGYLASWQVPNIRREDSIPVGMPTSQHATPRGATHRGRGVKTIKPDSVGSK